MNSLNPTYLQDMVTTINTKYTLRNPKPGQHTKRKTVAHGMNSLRYKAEKYGIVYLLTSKIVLP